MSVNTAIKSIAIFLLGSVLLYGCATQSLKLSVIRPAEINLKGFDKIAIGDIEDQNGGLSAHSKDISDKITSALFDSKRFEVLDRQHLGTLLKEHNFTASGLVDDKTAAELGSSSERLFLFLVESRQTSMLRKPGKMKPGRTIKGSLTRPSGGVGNTHYRFICQWLI